jgi:glycosyltransferase involved in cell wall biosynthesis
MAPGAPALERFAYRMFLRNSIEAADHVITVSEAMKNDILALFPKIDISVIYNGINAAKFHALTDVDIQSTQQRLELPGEFVMAVGHLEPRKNYLSLVKAMAILRNQGRPTHLIIIGNDSGELAAIEYAVKEAKLQGMVKILSDISDKDIHCCYKLCSLFVFPSTYEGFGIPILEAMAVGCPMALSDLPVFRELTQNRGLYFPPDKVADMAAVIELGLESSTERYRLVEYGHERIGQFGFHQLAVELERHYRSLATKSAELRSRYDETKGLNGQEYRP